MFDFDAATDGGNNANLTNSLTYAHTCSGSDRLLVVVVVGDVHAGADDVTGVTYSGVSMTAGPKLTTLTSGRYFYTFYLLNPASGANNVVVSSATAHYLLSGAASYTGVGAFDAQNTNTSLLDADGVLASTITIGATDAWAILFSFGFTDGSPATAGTGSTRRGFDGTFGTWGIFDSNTALGLGSYGMTFSYALSGSDMGAVLLSFGPAGVAARRFFLVPS
jgi:hypothetical protein